MNNNCYIVIDTVYDSVIELCEELDTVLHGYTTTTDEDTPVTLARWYKNNITTNDILSYILDTVLLLLNKDVVDNKDIEDGSRFTLDRIYRHMDLVGNLGDRTIANKILYVVYSKLRYELESVGILPKNKIGSMRLMQIKNKLVYIKIVPIYMLSK